MQYNRMIKNFRQFNSFTKGGGEGKGKGKGKGKREREGRGRREGVENWKRAE